MELQKFTIITVVLDGEAFIEDCIKSIVHQSYPQLEYIIVDGGSTDGTLDIVKKYTDKITKWISEPDRGISDAFNKGIALATGEYIGIINADDWLEADAIEKVAEFFNSYDVVYGNINQIYPENTYVAEANHNLLNKRMSMNHPATFVKKNTYNIVGLYDNNYKIAMDYEWLLRCRRQGCKFGYLPLVLTNMRMSGISSSNWKKGLKEVQLARKKHLPNSEISELDYWKQYFYTSVSIMLINSPLSHIFDKYRRYFSAIKKKKIKA